MGSDGMDQGRSTRHLWIPTFPAFVWIFFTIVVCFAVDGLSTVVSRDGDPALHVTLGRLMLESGGLLAEEPTCCGAADAKPFIAHEWLAQVLFALVHAAFGLAGPALLATFLYASCLALMTWWLVRTRTPAAWVVASVVAAALFLGFRLIARPHLFTWLFASVWILGLESWRRGRLPVSRLAWLGAALMVPWANLHGGFLIAFVLLGVYGLGALIDARRGLSPGVPPLPGLAAVAGVVALASLVNPFGWHLHAHLFSFLTDPVLASASAEFQPLDLGNLTGMVFLVVAGVTGLALLRRGRALSTVHVLLWLLLLAMALRSHRHTALFVLFVPLAGIAGPVRRTRPDEALDGRPLIGIAFAATVILVGVLGIPPTAFVASRMPVAALAHVEANPTLFEGRVFCGYSWGGYIAYERYPPQEVFMHGLNDHYGAAHVERYIRVRDAREGWRDILGTFDVRWAVVPPDDPIASAMAADAHWRRTYEDDIAVVFVHEHP